MLLLLVMEIGNSTESAVVFPGALHGAVRMDLQVEARPAVELPPPENPLQMAEVRQAPGQPLGGHQVLLLLPLSPHHQSRCGVVVHGPSRREDKMGAHRSRCGAEAVQEPVGEAPNLGRCPHHRSDTRIRGDVPVMSEETRCSRRGGGQARGATDEKKLDVEKNPTASAYFGAPLIRLPLK